MCALSARPLEEEPHTAATDMEYRASSRHEQGCTGFTSTGEYGLILNFVWPRIQNRCLFHIIYMAVAASALSGSGPPIGMGA